MNSLGDKGRNLRNETKIVMGSAYFFQGKEIEIDGSSLRN